MTYFDYAVLFILICSIVISTFNGFVKEALALSGWVAGFVVANTFGAQFSMMLPEAIGNGSMRLIVAFIVLFLGTRIAAGLLSKAMSILVKTTGLTVADRGLGGLLGLGRGLVIVLTLVMLCGMTAVPQQTFWKRAMFSPLAETAAHTVMPFLPVGVSSRIRF